MNEFYRDWRISIDDKEGGGILVFAPHSNYGAPIFAETMGEGLTRAIAYIDRQIAPQVSIFRNAVDAEAQNLGLDFSKARKRVGI